MQSMRLQKEGLIGVNHLSLFAKKHMPSETEENSLSSAYMLPDHTWSWLDCLQISPSKESQKKHLNRFLFKGGRTKNPFHPCFYIFKGHYRKIHHQSDYLPLMQVPHDGAFRITANHVPTCFHLSFSGSVGHMAIGYFASEHRSSRDHVTLYNAIHGGYMSGICCQLGHDMLLTTHFRNQQNPLESFYCSQASDVGC